MSSESNNPRPSGNDERLIMRLAAEVGKLAAHGEVNATERVLAAHAEVEPDDELIMSLLYEEVLAAEGMEGETTFEAGLIDRFPELRERITRLIAFHQSFSEHDDPLASDRKQDPSYANETNAQFELLDTHKTKDQAKVVPRYREFDQFEILEKIGQGGMGVVYRARQKKLNRVVALKLLRNPLIDEVERSRFMNEARAVAKLKHPGIVQIYDVGETDQQPFLCFEYVEGVQLAERLRDSTMAPDDACRLLSKIANAVSWAHQQGIVHRDLKPANILLDSNGQPKVADFGLAKFQATGNEPENSHRLTQTGAIVGTICYMAPEQFTGGKNRVDPRIDLYGLGAIFYEMLVGRPPQIGDTPDETMFQVTTQEPVPPRKLNPRIPRDVETICLKCLEKDPANRFQTGQELEQELQRYLSGQPLSIRPASSLQVAFRWCRRRPAIALLSALSALLLVLLTLGGYWMAWNQTQHASELERQRDVSRDSARLAADKAAEAKAATQFMINTLGSAHPERDGKNVTVAERLADGLREVNVSYPDDSTTRASLLKAIGDTYVGLGLLTESVIPLQQAWELYCRLDGDQSLAALEAEVSYGDVLRQLGRRPQAAERLQHAEKSLERLLGPHASESIVASVCVAQNRYQRGETDTALELFAESCERARSALPPTHPTTINSVLVYADALKQVGQIERSRELVTGLLEPAIKDHGLDSLLVIELKGALASIERAAGNFPLALEQFKEIHRTLDEKLGDQHIKTLISLSGVAITLTDLGNYDQALEILSQVADRTASKLGQSHPQTLRAILNKARTLEALDRHQQARDLIHDAYQRAQSALGAQHPETMMMATHYGRQLAEDNQLEQAEVLLAAAVEYFRNEDLAQPSVRAEPFNQLANLYKRTERLEPAIELYQQALEISRDAFGESHPETLTAKNNLAGAYSKARRADQAIEVYENVLADLRNRVGDENPKTLKTALNLAIVYRDESRPEDAIDILMTVLPTLQQQAAGSWLTSTAEFQLGRAYLDNGQVDNASRHLEAAYAGFERLVDQLPATQRYGLGNQIKTIVTQLESHDRLEAADNWRQRSAELLGR